MNEETGTTNMNLDAQVARLRRNDQVCDVVMDWGRDHEDLLDLDDLRAGDYGFVDSYEVAREMFLRAAGRLIVDLAHAMSYHGADMRDVSGDAYYVYMDEIAQDGPTPLHESNEEAMVAEYFRSKSSTPSDSLSELLAFLEASMAEDSSPEVEE